jgi:hypothetical protein
MNSYDVAAIVITGYLVLLWKLYEVSEKHRKFRICVSRLLTDIATKHAEVTLDGNSVSISKRSSDRKIQRM